MSLLLLLVIVTVPVYAEIIHQVTIPGLHSYPYTSPIVAVDGQYHGIVATDAANDNVDVFDAEGQRIHSIHLTEDIANAIGRLSDNLDTLVLYAAADSGAEMYGFELDVYRIEMITMVNNQMTIKRLRPSFNIDTYLQTPMFFGSTSGMQFDFDRNYHLCGVFARMSLTTDVMEFTMGQTYEDHFLMLEYDLDLADTILNVPVQGCTKGHFLGDDTCGLALYTRYYWEVVDDPWNSYSYYGTHAYISNCDSAVGGMGASHATTQFMVAGDFLPSIPTDELIYAGSGYEFVGPQDSAVYHWSCYSFANDTLTREWRITPPSFEYSYYNTNRNALVGFAGGLTVRFFNCEAATITDSCILDRAMGDKRFLLAPGIDLPDLFGRVYDTVYVYRLDAVTDIDAPDEYNLPTDYALAQNYPNPFNPTTRIRFSIPRAGDVQLDVFNIAGQRVATLIDARLNAGDHDISFDAHNLASGIYLYRLTVGEYTASRKMIVLK